jgi:tetratricopeptide (TPR) repeat protein
MTVEQENNENNAPVKPFSRLPWLIGIGALLLYVLTLNHWVSMSSLPAVSKLTGWDWHPTWLDWRNTTFTPLWLVVTSPARLLPVDWRPFFLNALSAVCAALTLVLLARSIRILPQDRTRHQRLRNNDPAWLLDDKYAWIPQIVAVLACGLQRSFWEHAISATGEMLDLLVFAALIWCLLEFRHSRREDWLNRFALLYGIGMANNWALIGFFPFFLVSLIWIKGEEFFNWSFIRRMSFRSAIGLLLYLLAPAVSAMAGGGNYFHLLIMELMRQKIVLLMVPKWAPLLLAIPTIVPLFFIGIRWPSFQGETSALGSAISNFFFQFMHVLFFAGSLWMFLDIFYSPRAIFDSLAFLPFYYMAALSVGYFLGFFLLVCLNECTTGWAKRTPFESAAAKATLGVVTLAGVAAVGWIAWTNTPKIIASNRPVLKTYAEEMARSIPPQGAIVLCDDHIRLMLLEGGFQSLHRANNNILIETDSLQYKQYLEYLSQNYPSIREVLGPVTNLPPMIDSISVLRLLSLFNERTKLPIYYLHPSFGFFFEQFYMTPRGFGGDLTRYPGGVLDVPVLSEQSVAANTAFWKNAQSGFLVDTIKCRDVSADAASVGWYVSRSANAWGVELQRLNRLKEAESMFKLASDLNPNNHMAKANAQYNLKLQDRNPQPTDNTDLIREALQQTRSWQGFYSADGPADEPDLIFRFGKAFADNSNYRQAYHLFQRRLTLLPNDFDTQVALGKTFVDMRLPDKAIAMTRRAEAKAVTPADQTELLRVEAFSYLIQTNWVAAETLLVNACKKEPKDDRRLALMVEYYRIAGSLMLQNNEAQMGREQFRKALVASDNLLALLKTLNRTGSSDEAEALFRKSEVQMQLEDYPGAIGTLGVLLLRSPDNPSALMNRAIAQLKCKKYAEAKYDYERVAKQLPKKSYAISFGLGEVAFATNDKKNAIKQYKEYLKLAPPNSPDYDAVRQRLASLEGGK